MGFFPVGVLFHGLDLFLRNGLYVQMMGYDGIRLGWQSSVSISYLLHQGDGVTGF